MRHRFWGTTAGVTATLVMGTLVVGAVPALAAASINVTAAGDLIARLSEAGTLRLGCGAGKVTLNGAATTFSCGSIKSIIIVGSAGADRIDTSTVTAADFSGLRVPTADTRPVDLQGQAGLDTIIGGPLGEVLRGGAGADQLKGRGGDDILFGGADNDTLRGGFGTDLVLGDVGDDALSGDDVVNVDDGANDTLRGANGTDTLYLTNGDTGATNKDTVVPDKVYLRISGSAPNGQTIMSFDARAGAQTPAVVEVTMSIEGTWELDDGGQPAQANVSLRESFPSGWHLGLAGVGVVRLALSGVDDRITVKQHRSVRFDLNGNGGVSDTLVVRLIDPASVDDGTAIRSPLAKTISYIDFEALIFE